MASVDKESIKQLRSLSQCCICLTTYKDPRMLQCFHSACLKCFKDIQLSNEKMPGDVLPCPLCRTEFTIPPEGMKGLSKNFFIESLMEVTKSISIEGKSVSCNICSTMEEASDVTEATMRCLNCQENYCLRCSKIHKSQKLGKDHKIVEINTKLNEDEIRNMFPIRKCKIHSEKVLDYYCSDCKTVVCVSCFVEVHKLHECKDVTTVDKDFRQRLEESSTKMSDYAEQMMSKKVEMERQSKEFLAKTLETENSIKTKSQQMKDLIDQHTQIVLDELSLLKQKERKNFETEIEEIERKLTVLESFVAYCFELKSKGSPSEVCGYVDNLIARAKELSEESEEYLSAPRKSVEVEFIGTDQNALLKNVDNVIGKLSEATKQIESGAVIIGIGDICSVSNEVIRINLNRSEDVSSLEPIPTTMVNGSSAAVYCNSICVTGIGMRRDEIWRFNAKSSKWKKCASLVRGRRRHSVAFVDHVLYICGGFAAYDESILEDVEAYDSIDDNCAIVGKLVNSTCNSGNCVSFKASLYIFGGYDDFCEAVSDVQVYDTKSNTCTLLSKPMPRAHTALRATLWENTVILLSSEGCFVYRFDTETWEIRDHFKPNVDCFGFSVSNGNMFVIGGYANVTDSDGNENAICQDDVKYIPIKNILNDEPIEWRHHAKLPKPSPIFAFGKMDFYA